MSVPRYTRSLASARYPIMSADIASPYTYRTFYSQVSGLDVSDGVVGLWSAKTDKVLSTVAEPLLVASSSTDDHAGGIGARIIVIEGLDANFDQILEEVSLAQALSVLTVQSFLRVNRVFILSTGGSANQGVITIIGNVSGDLQGYMDIGEGISKSTYLTIPAGYSAYIGDINLFAFKSSGGQSPIVTFKLMVGINSPEVPPPFTSPNCFYTQFTFHMDTSVLDNLNLRQDLYDVIPEKSDVHIAVDTTEDNTEVNGQFQIIYEKGGNYFRPVV